MAQMNRVKEMPIEAVAPPRSRWARFLDWLGNPWGYVLVLPSVLIYITFEIWPIFRGIMMAFSPYSWVVPETRGLFIFNGLDNYRELLRTQEWRKSMWIATKFASGELPLNFTFALFTAVMISKVSHPKWAGFFRIIFYLPVVMPIAVAFLLWRNLYSTEYGYINYFLKRVFHMSNPPNWIYDRRWSLLSAVIATAWKNFGSNTMLFLVGIYSINRELYEAAQIDGASEWQQFWKVTLPLLKPIIVMVLVLGSRIVSATQEVMVLFSGAGFDVTWDTGWGGPFQSCLTTGLWAYLTAFARPDMRMGLAASASLILGLMSMFLSIIFFRLLRAEPT